ncbi:MAG: heavy-metal-associated domain-containing protein [Rhodanobacteraceae bacterium]
MRRQAEACNEIGHWIFRRRLGPERTIASVKEPEEKNVMLKSISLYVVGDPQLHCESCEQRVVRALKSLAGIQQVRAEAASQRIEVLFDSAKLEESAIAERLGLLGYTTEVTGKVAPSRH